MSGIIFMLSCEFSKPFNFCTTGLYTELNTLPSHIISHIHIDVMRVHLPIEISLCGVRRTCSLCLVDTSSNPLTKY